MLISPEPVVVRFAARDTGPAYTVMGPGTETSPTKFRLAVLPLLPSWRPVIFVRERLLIGKFTAEEKLVLWGMYLNVPVVVMVRVLVKPPRAASEWRLMSPAAVLVMF